MTKVAWFACLFFWFAWNGQAQQLNSQFGRYTGWVEHQKFGLTQLAKLDFIESREDGKELRLLAVLSVYWGGFESDEYVSYHFDKVRYNLVTGILVFDQADQDVSFVVKTFAEGKLKGELRTAAGQLRIPIELSQKDKPEPKLPLFHSLMGQYRGMCDGFSSILQIQTSRSSEEIVRTSDPFGSFILTAQLAEDDLGSCLGESSSCVRYVYSGGNHNFFQGELELYGSAHQQLCKLTKDGLICNGCNFKKTFPKISDPVTMEVSTSTPKWLDTATPSAAGGLDGKYFGYVHNERLNIYQKMSFDIVSFQDPDMGGQGSLKISGVGTLFFGDYSSQEYIPYKFKEKTFPLISPILVFEQMDGDMDAIVQLRKFGDGALKGIWFSMLYGRVGEFLAMKDAAPKLPPEAVLMENVAGTYKGDNWLINMKIARENTPRGTRNPFFPLNMKGHVEFIDITPRIGIASGSFDFYTGKFFLNIEDGSLFSGKRPGREKLLLQRPTAGPARPLLSPKLQVFQLKN